MKKGISWCAFPAALPTARKFELAAAAGYNGIEVPAVTDIEELQDLRNLADDHGIEIPSIIETESWKLPLSSSDPAVTGRITEKLKNNLRYASSCGIGTILCVPGVVDSQTHYPVAHANALAQFKDMAKIAEAHSVTLAIENVWNKFLLTPLEFRDFIDEVDSPFVKAYFDCGNICLYGFPDDWIRILGKDRIAKIHVKGFTDYPNEIGFPKTLVSDVPWREILTSLREIGYDDYLTVEIKAAETDFEEKLHQYSAELDEIISTH